MSEPARCFGDGRKASCVLSYVAKPQVSACDVDRVPESTLLRPRACPSAHEVLVTAPFVASMHSHHHLHEPTRRGAKYQIIDGRR